MNEGVIATCRAFLDTLPPKEKNALLNFLSKDALDDLQRAPLMSRDLTKGIPSKEEELSNIHATWIAPLMRTLPKGEIGLFLSALSQESVKELQSLLLFTNHIPSPSALGRVFLRKTLMEMVSKEERCPPDCLPAHPLNQLLSLSMKDVLSFIDLLSMHDLAVEVRTIIGAAKLKAIYEVLTKPQYTLLQTITHAKEPVVFRHPLLKNWSGDPTILQVQLRERGLNRLAKALVDLHPDLLWHLAHHLDVQHGEKLISFCTPLDTPRISELLIKQATSLLASMQGAQL